ncbi:MAG: hypothetical protein Q9191_004252 [Dirinaria sp. TL-2023a]
MPSIKLCIQLAFVASFVCLVTILHSYAIPYLSLATPKLGAGFDETVMETPVNTPRQRLVVAEPSQSGLLPTPFRPGKPKPPGSQYSRVMVVPRTKDEDISWISQEVPDLDLTMYVADDPEAELHPPKNKGHEVMVYLSYIIDHYYTLPDISIFMHAHRWTHHNNLFLGADASQMLRRLSNEHVVREGYMNMRCHWDPGCPEWLHFNGTKELIGKQEEAYLAKSWKELFPLEPFPAYLAQPCCAQFALSRQRILSIPLSRFVFFRDWMMKTPLTDYISGRILEYSWQFIFTGKSALCPAEHICYCDGFGLCFGSAVKYEEYVQAEQKKQKLGKNLEELKEADAASKSSSAGQNLIKIAPPDPKRLNELQGHISAIEGDMARWLQEANERGRDPKLRAEECGRQWSEGDGF